MANRLRTALGVGTLVAFAHALATWSPALALSFFAFGALLAFTAEALGVALGLLRHRTAPSLLGVPLHVAAAWPAVAYAAYRVSRFAFQPGVEAVLAAAVLATAVDLLVDARGVTAGYWTYPPHRLSRRRSRGVPWWNFAAWMVLVALTAAIPALVWGR